ncbi:PGF-CTERM sorting domain-containing protein [Methanococcoides methylutens]|uniref:PGF-CTERM sorting domain-containing protein n=1 Tax=Methanococcoides methylutens TaxID=2226 RepID=UPI004043DF17
MNEETSIREIVVSEGGEYSEVWDEDNNVKMIISGIIPPNIYTETDGDYLIYRHTITDNLTISDYSEYGAAAIDVHYYLEMPGEIVESNANVVDGNKAEWHMVGGIQPEDIYAKSELPSIPGFGIISSILAMLAIAFFFRKG